MTDEFDLDLVDILEEEETPISYNNLPAEPRVSNNVYADAEVNKQKLTKVEEELAQLRSHLEAGKKTNFMDRAFAKYSNIDPEFKDMLAEVILGYNQVSQAEMKPIFDHLDNLQRQIALTKKSIDDVNVNVSSFQNTVAFDNLVLQYLQRGFKKNSVTRDHLEAAKAAHTKKLKDEAYYLKVDNIVNRQNMSGAQKDRLIGQLILDNFREEIAKKQAKGKTSESDPVLKKKVDKDESVEKAQKKLDKEMAKEATETEEVPEMTEEQQTKRREATLSRLNKLRGL